MKKQCKKDSKGQQKIGDVFRIIFPNFNKKYAFFPIKNGRGSFEKRQQYHCLSSLQWIPFLQL